MAKSTGGTKRVVSRTTAKTRTVTRPATKAPAAPKVKAPARTVTPRVAAPARRRPSAAEQARAEGRLGGEGNLPVDELQPPVAAPLEHLRQTREQVKGQLDAVTGLQQYVDEHARLTAQLQQLDADIAAREAAGG